MLLEIELLEQATAQRGLTRPRRSGHEHEPFLLRHPIEQLLFRDAVLLRLEHEPRVGGQREGLLAQPEEIFIHVQIPRCARDDGGRTRYRPATGWPEMIVGVRKITSSALRS